MDYVRSHIKKHTVYLYGRTIGISLLLFALFIAITVTALSFLNFANLVSTYLLLAVLFLFSSLIVILNIINIHATTAKLMNPKEHAIHSKNTIIWSVVLFLSVIVLLSPLLILRTSFKVVVLLFSLGGILLIIYLTIGGIFKQYFHELGLAGVALWIIFAVNSFYLTAVPILLEYFVTVITLILIFGITGVAIIFNSSQALAEDYIEIAQKTEAKKRRR